MAAGKQNTPEIGGKVFGEKNRIKWIECCTFSAGKIIPKATVNLV
jgi:hypothetical protein